MKIQVRVVLVLVLLLVTGGKQSQLLVLGLSLELDKNKTILAQLLKRFFDTIEMHTILLILLLPGIADQDGEAGGEEHEDEEELLG